MTIALTKEAKKTLSSKGFWFWGICKVFSVIWIFWVVSFMKIPTSFYGIIISIGFVVAIATIMLNAVMHFEILIQIFVEYFQILLKSRRSNNMR